MMSAQPHPPEAHVDLSIEVSGGPLPRDHSLPVWNAVAHAAPALMEQTTLAILPVRAAAGYDGRLVLQRRTRLLMRLPESAVDTVLALSGRRLHIGGFPVLFGAVKTRPLAAHVTLYAHRVAATHDDESAFVEQVTRELDALGVRGEFIVGKRTDAAGPEGLLAGFSLMLTDLSARQSLLLQASGLGRHRNLGFGIFVGHK